MIALMRKVFILGAVILAMTAGSLGAASEPVTISDSYPHQGDTVLLKFSNSNFIPQSVVFNDISEPIFNYGNVLTSIFGVGAGQATGNYRLKLVFKNGQSLVKTIKVLKTQVAIINLPVPEQVGLSSDELVTNLAVENASLNDMFSSTTPQIFFTSAFGLPLSDNRHLASTFGEIRNTGGNMIRHLGIDFAAPAGASVWAINNGIVRKAYNDQIYGNTVVLDHGDGIYSMYLHLKAMKVKTGDVLKKGNLIGWVGTTGLSTAPHLHLSLKIGNISVNPLKFVSVFSRK